ncbi:MAG: lipocalin family protein [Chitinophagales bacterium]
MKQLILKITSAIILFSSSLPACNKSSSHIKTNTELLTQSTWRFSTATVGGTDVSAFLQTCQKDNILTFVSAGTGTLDEGATKCNSGDPQTTPFTWSLMSTETILHISTVLFTGGSSDFNIITLSETQLVVSQNITVSGTTQNAVVTFIH